VLGHFRHEIAHYFCDDLIQGTNQLQGFRDLFGDERADYQTALKSPYEEGPRANWPDRYIGAYASTHPWEDWAESWALVMHRVDALDNAYAVGLSVQPPRKHEPSLTILAEPSQARIRAFNQLVGEHELHPDFALFAGSQAKRG
jgi:hypothetical protein